MIIYVSFTSAAFQIENFFRYNTFALITTVIYKKVLNLVNFCPECSNLLRKRTMNGDAFLVCRCGYSRKIEEYEIDLENDALKKKKALDKNLIIISEDDKILVHPIVDKYCPKCDHKKAEAWQEQTRSADEASTSFFRCVKCKHTWREY